MATAKTIDVTSVVQRFDDAWHRADIDRLMSLVSDDCIYDASVGPGPGREFIGKLEVRRGFMEMLEYDNQSERDGKGQIVIVDDARALVLWSVHGRAPAGNLVTIRGCDLFQVRDGLIRRKDAFRKGFA